MVSNFFPLVIHKVDSRVSEFRSPKCFHVYLMRFSVFLTLENSVLWQKTLTTQPAGQADWQYLRFNLCHKRPQSQHKSCKRRAKLQLCEGTHTYVYTGSWLVATQNLFQQTIIKPLKKLRNPLCCSKICPKCLLLCLKAHQPKHQRK